MARRGSGEGSIYKRADGRWAAAVVTWEAGVRKRRAFYGKTRAEVRSKLARAQRALDDGLPLPSERVTVAAFLASWLQTKRPDLRPESYRRYEEAVRLYLVPQLGRHALARLTPAHVLTAYATMREGVSGTTLSLIHGVLRGALKDAVRWGSVARNVTDAVATPRRSTEQTEALTADQARRLLGAAQGEPLEAFYVLALTAGMRLGELQALSWAAVDLDRRRLEVRATYQGNVDGVPVFAPPKTERSRRTVQLSALAVDALRGHRVRQHEQRLLVGSLWQDHGLVFATAFGRPLDGNNLRARSFAGLLERAELPPMRFHALRHCAATLLMAEGVPIKAVSELLGHSDIATTLRIYSHVLPTMHGAAADAMDRIFAAEGGA
ncbi:MAG: site-specific integrase [Chloroflexi bacterium]|nr:site-specific integrase [Chloroflexota bacterium]